MPSVLYGFLLAVLDASLSKRASNSAAAKAPELSSLCSLVSSASPCC